RKFIEYHNNAGAACSILSVRLEHPSGYGRIIRAGNESFQKIVEHRDATDEQRQVREINSGIYCFDAKELYRALRKVEPANDQGEYYLTDVAEIILAGGGTVSVYIHGHSPEVYGLHT